MVEPDLVRAIAALLEAVIWPVILVTLLVVFGDSVRSFIADLGQVTLSAGGVDVTATRQQEMKAAALVGAATVRKPSEETADMTDAESAQTIAAELLRAIGGGARRRLAETSVLWVDDEPGNNVVEREALRALGVRVTTSRSTEDALEKLEADGFDLLVTDMGRAGDDEAGYTLLDRLGERGDETPVVVYTHRDLDREVARRRGAFGVAGGPPELFTLALRAVLDGS